MSTYRARVIAEGVALQEWQEFHHDTDREPVDTYAIADKTIKAFADDQREHDFDAPDALVVIVEKVPELGQ